MNFFQAPPLLVLVILSMVIDDYFNSCVRVYIIGVTAQIKIIGESPLLFTGLWFEFKKQLIPTSFR
jgi:hypothetical protein